MRFLIVFHDAYLDGALVALVIRVFKRFMGFLLPEAMAAGRWLVLGWVRILRWIRILTVRVVL